MVMVMVDEPDTSDPLGDDGEEETEDVPEVEPEVWHEAVLCPACGSEETRLVERRYEVGVYTCERCDTSFEGE